MKLRVELDWRTTLATLVLVPTLVGLGFWQLDRAHEKTLLIERLDARRSDAPMTLRAAAALPDTALADRPVVLDATFVKDRYVLLDNRIRSGRFGYEVVAFVTVDGVIAPLNLGWIEGDRSRLEVPTPTLPEGEHRVQARIYRSSGEAFMLGSNPLPPTLPGVVQQLTLADWESELTTHFGRSVFPFEVRALPGEPIAYAADWGVVNQSPAKHHGYAVQWFTMALALSVAFVVRSSNVAGWLRHQFRTKNR